jgi:hypothetical protein
MWDHDVHDPEDSTRRGPAPPRTHCELTVAGVLGPMLTQACRAEPGASARTCTVLRTRLPEDLDLPELVRLLDARGLRVLGVTDLGR